MPRNGWPVLSHELCKNLLALIIGEPSFRGKKVNTGAHIAAIPNIYLPPLHIQNELARRREAGVNEKVAENGVRGGVEELLTMERTKPRVKEVRESKRTKILLINIRLW